MNIRSAYDRNTALNLTFTSQARGPGVHVAMEQDAASSRKLVEAIQEVMKRAEVCGFVGE